MENGCMTTVLVPIAVLKGETVAPGLIDLLSPMDVTVLGYHVVPEQTSPDQARTQHKERATSALEDTVQEFQQAGGTAESRLVFTHDRRKTIRRVADEMNAEAIATTGATGDVERILVSLTGDVDVNRILAFVMELVRDRNIGVTLFVAEEATESVRELLDESAKQLADATIDARAKLVTGPPFNALVEAVPDHDVIVIGEKAPSLTSFLFGEESDRLASASVGPVLVVKSNAELGKR